MSGYGLAGSSNFWKVTWVWGLAGSEFFYDDEVDICSGCNQLERKASVKSQNLIYIFFIDVLKLILQATPFVKIFIE